MEISWDTRLSGPLVVVHEETRVWAGGPGLPTVELRNTGQERRRDVPIGTRRADDLTLTLGVVTRSESGDLDVDRIHDPEGNRLRRRAPLPTPDEVAVLGALAHGFGVGARLMVAALVAGMLELLA